MKIEDIIKGIKQLAISQGFYERLYNRIMEMTKEEFKSFKEELEAQNFSDIIDFVLYIEGGN